MTEQNFNTAQQSALEEIDLVKYIGYLVMQSKVIIIITFVALALSVANYISSTKIYKISSLLEVKSFNQSSLDPTDTLQMMSPMRPLGELDSLISLYKSRTNLLQIISDLNLNVEIDKEALL